MDFEKQFDRQKRINISLKDEIAKLNQQLEEYQIQDMEPDMQVQNLILHLQEIEKEWGEALADIHKSQEEYHQLLSEMKEFRNKVMGDTALARWVNKRLR